MSGDLLLPDKITLLKNPKAMKKTILLFYLFLVATSMSAQQLYVGSYNIRYHNEPDSLAGNVWSKRLQVMSDQILFEQPDIFGAQEVLVDQLRDFERTLPQYGHIGVGRDDGMEKGEYAAIFYLRDRVKLLDQGNFWLSEHPEVPGLGWDAACVRICTWGKFKLLHSRLRFYYFNLHMDHVGKVARREAAKLVVSKIREIAGNAPVVLTGDFNVDQKDEIYAIFTRSGILVDSYTVAEKRFAENGTFNSFNTDLHTDSRIDHIFLSPGFIVERYGVLTDSYWTPNEQNVDEQKGHDAPQEISFKPFVKRAPSDHYPVMAHIKWKKK